MKIDERIFINKYHGWWLLPFLKDAVYPPVRIDI